VCFSVDELSRSDGLKRSAWEGRSLLEEREDDVRDGGDKERRCWKECGEDLPLRHASATLWRVKRVGRCASSWHDWSLGTSVAGEVGLQTHKRLDSWDHSGALMVYRVARADARAAACYL